MLNSTKTIFVIPPIEAQKVSSRVAVFCIFLYASSNLIFSHKQCEKIQCCFTLKHWRKELLCQSMNVEFPVFSDRDLSNLGTVPESAQALILAGNKLRIDTLITNTASQSAASTTMAANLSNIQYVDLSQNELRFHQVEPLHKLFTQLQSLRALDLSNNYLESLQPSLFNGLKSLQFLSLSGNTIVYIERNTFQTLTNLKTLKLNNNLLRAVNAEWFNNVSLSLRDLDLSGNRLGAIRETDLVHVKHIERLNLSKNNISEIDENCLVDSEIRELDISHNQLTLMPFSFINTLKQLTILNINNNSVVTLNYRDTGAISRLPYLKQVSLSYMPKLKVIPEFSFSHLPSLIKLELFENPQLRFINPRFCFSCPNLTVLYIHNNALEGLDEKILIENPSLAELSLYNNNLHCGCFASWLRNTNGSVTIIDGDKMVCQSPHSVKSATLYQLTSEQLEADCDPQIIRISPPEVTVQWGSRVYLECQSIGAETLYWIRPNQRDDDVDDGIVMHDNKLPNFRYELVVHGNSHESEGVYSCLAESKQGLRNSQSVFVRISHPAVQLKTTAVSKSFIVLTWEQTSGSKVITYAADDGVIREIMLGEDVTQYTLEDLRPNSGYKICLLYHNRTDENCITVHMLPLKRVDMKEEKTNSKANSSQVNGMILLITLTALAAVVIVGIAVVVYKKCQRYKLAKVVYSRHLNESCSVDSSMHIKIDQCYNPTTAPLCDNEVC